MSMMRLSSPGSSLLGKNMFIVIAENCIDRPCTCLFRRTIAGCRPTARMPQEPELSVISGRPKPAMR